MLDNYLVGLNDSTASSAGGCPSTAWQLNTKKVDVIPLYYNPACNKACTFCLLVLGDPLNALLCLSKEVGHHVSNKLLLIVSQLTKIVDGLDAFRAQRHL